MSVAYSDRIRAEQIKSIYTNTTPGMVASWFACTVLTIGLVYIDVAMKSRAIIFIVVMFAHTAGRVVLFQAFSRRNPPVGEWRRWARLFTIGTVIGGATIGIGSVWMMPPGSTDMQLAVFLIIFSVASGAVSAFGAYLPAFYLFLASISIVPAVWLLTRDDVFYVIMGLLFVVWFAAVAEQARRTSIAFVNTINLRFENMDLVADLRREKAVAEEANAAKSRFLAAASHDLRQPVHALSLFVEAARSHAMKDETRELLDHIDNSVQSMSKLFGGLLDISRLDAGVVEVNRLPFAIKPLIERVAHEFEAQANAKGLKIRIRAADAIVQSDPILFERVLRNIIANAVSYTDQGRVLVGCRRGRRLKVQVWDTGRGIPDDERQQVFQEFYQIGNPERDRNKGVGLGLAIVKRLTTLLDHPLTLKSTPSRGTCFSIELPYANAAAAPLTNLEEHAPSVARGSGLILVLDDESTIQLGMKTLLESWGYSVITASNCEEMLEKIATHPEVPRLIICDYRLREHETGTEVIERLRSEYNDEIPGMLVTGDTAPDRLKEAQDSGFLLLHKPVPNSRLRAAITHLIGV